MSTPLALLSSHKFPEEKKISNLLREESNNIRRIEWCIDIVVTSNFPIFKDIVAIKKALSITEEKLNKVLPRTLEQYEKIQSLKREIESVNEEIPSNFILTLTKITETLGNIFWCGSSTLPPQCQLDIDYANEPNLISKLLKFKRNSYDKKNI